MLKPVTTFRNGVVGSRRNTYRYYVSCDKCIPSYLYREDYALLSPQKFGFPQGIISMHPSLEMFIYVILWDKNTKK